MKLLILISIIALPNFAAANSTRIKAPLISGKIQAEANCIQCGGRFICGHTDQNVKLKYDGNFIKATVQDHCAKRSHEISENIRVNGATRTEESVRFKEFFSSIVMAIQRNKGGNITFKKENGFNYEDFKKFTSRKRPSSRKELKKFEKINTKKLRRLEAQNIVLPVVSEKGYASHLLSQTGTNKLINKKTADFTYAYREYVKDLLILHPSELTEVTPNSGIFVGSGSVNSKLKASLDRQFGSKAVGGINLVASNPDSPIKPKGEKAEGEAIQKRGIATPEKEDSLANKVQYDEFGNIINDKLIKQRDSELKQKASDDLLKKSLKSQALQRARNNGAGNSSSPGGSLKSYSYYRPSDTSAVSMTEIFRRSNDSLCAKGNTTASVKYVKSASESIAKNWGGDDSLTNSDIQEDLNQKLAQALKSDSPEDCAYQIRSIFDNDDLRLASGATKELETIQAAVDAREGRRTRYVASRRVKETPEFTPVKDAVVSPQGTIGNNQVKTLAPRIKPVSVNTSSNKQVEIAKNETGAGDPTKYDVLYDVGQERGSSTAATKGADSCEKDYLSTIQVALLGEGVTCNNSEKLKNCALNLRTEKVSKNLCGRLFAKNSDKCNKLVDPNLLTENSLLATRDPVYSLQNLSITKQAKNSKLLTLIKASRSGSLLEVEKEIALLSNIRKATGQVQASDACRVFSKAYGSKELALLKKIIGQDPTLRPHNIPFKNNNLCSRAMTLLRKHELDLAHIQEAKKTFAAHVAAIKFPHQVPTKLEDTDKKRSLFVEAISESDLSEYLSLVEHELISSRSTPENQQVFVAEKELLGGLKRIWKFQCPDSGNDIEAASR